MLQATEKSGGRGFPSGTKMSFFQWKVFASKAYRVKYLIFHWSPIICMTISRGGQKLILNINENCIWKSFFEISPHSESGLQLWTDSLSLFSAKCSFQFAACISYKKFGMLLSPCPGNQRNTYFTQKVDNNSNISALPEWWVGIMGFSETFFKVCTLPLKSSDAFWK